MLGPDNSFKVSPTLADHAKRLGASLESVALFALYDVADQSLLRDIAGREFCEQVERLALLTGLHTSEARVNWRSAYKLADQWGPHIPDKKDEIENEWETLINRRLSGS